MQDINSHSEIGGRFRSIIAIGYDGGFRNITS
jgi:hypothetical protein